MAGGGILARMLRAIALPVIIVFMVVGLWMYFGDWHSTQATDTTAKTQAAQAVDAYYSTSSATSSLKSDSFTLQGDVAGAVPVTGTAATTSGITSSIKTNNKKYMNAVLHTSKGDIKIEFSAETPKTVENFSKLAGSGFYNGTKFHRVISGFMIQGGDPLTKDDSKQAMWGTGGPGYSFADEIHADNSNVIGSVAMANSGPNTNGSQFFINVADNNFLDTKHTVFAHVVSGMDVVKAIESSHTDNDRPVEPISISGVTLGQ